MPTQKNHLNRAERAKYLVCAKEIQARGLDREIPGEWEENCLGLDILVASPQGNILHQLSDGMTGYAIWVKITATIGNLIVEDFAIASEWDSELVAVRSNARGLYGVGAAIEFAEQETLNGRIENELRFRLRGDTAEGWVVASSLNPIPDQYPNRMITELRLSFTDQFGHDHSAQAEAAVERSTRLEYPDFRTRKSDLYGTRISRVPAMRIGSRGTSDHQANPSGSRTQNVVNTGEQPGAGQGVRRM